MTDLERKLAEALRGQAEEVTPNLDAAWAEQMRRQRKPHRRRLTVLIAPLAAVLVVLTSVLLATQLNNDPAPLPPAKSETSTVSVAKPEHRPSAAAAINGGPVELMKFAGQTDAWSVYAFTNRKYSDATPWFCLAAMPAGRPFEATAPQYGTKSPLCAPIGATADQVIFAQQVGEEGGPLPAGHAVYLADCTVRELRLYDQSGDLSQASRVGQMLGMCLFSATITAGKPPVRFEAHSGQVVRSGRIEVS
ncbi:hypothetical protein ABZ342_41270 [Amycolatopsis sp. NPDC005961]|uniref:hypothetical protein n=1 Tax=Amycolatopsis sp. NPDC005961 TaxID=3156720 RepID=UPI003404C7F4